MKYKVGQKVLMRRYGNDYINYTPNAIQRLKDSNYIFTIEEVSSDSREIGVKENTMQWYNFQVAEVYDETCEPEPLPVPIGTRFEILDL